VGVQRALELERS